MERPEEAEGGGRVVAVSGSGKEKLVERKKTILLLNFEELEGDFFV